MDKRRYNLPFIYTIDTPEKLLEQYTLEMVNFENIKMVKVVNYILTLDDFDRIVYLLYIDYKSYRKVAQETNREYKIIYTIVTNINKDLKKIIEL